MYYGMKGTTKILITGEVCKPINTQQAYYVTYKYNTTQA